MASFDSLPKELQDYVISFIPFPNLIKIIPLVSKSWKSKFRDKYSLEKLSLSSIIVPKASNTILNNLLNRFKFIKSIDFKRWGENINKSTLQIISNFHQIRSLNLEGCKKLTFENIEELSSKLTNLRKIDLRGCYNIVKFSFNSNFLHRLEYLNLSSLTITSEELTSILHLSPNLEELNVMNCLQISDVSFFPHNSSLTKLCLALAPITDKTAQSIAENATNLKDLNLQNCVLLSTTILNQMISKCTKLTHLNLIDTCFGQIDDRTLSEISERLPFIQELNLKDSCITSQGIISLTRCTCLQILNFEYCLTIDDFGVTTLLNSIGRNMYTLNLRACLLTANTLNCIASNCTSIMNLNLSTWNQIPEDALIQIAKRCTSLQAINLSYSEGVTEKAVREILQNCKYLKKLNVSGLEQVHNMLQNSTVHVIFD